MKKESPCYSDSFPWTPSNSLITKSALWVEIFPFHPLRTSFRARGDWMTHFLTKDFRPSNHLWFSSSQTSPNRRVPRGKSGIEALPSPSLEQEVGTEPDLPFTQPFNPGVWALLKPPLIREKNRYKLAPKLCRCTLSLDLHYAAHHESQSWVPDLIHLFLSTAPRVGSRLFSLGSLSGLGVSVAFLISGCQCQRRFQPTRRCWLTLPQFHTPTYLHSESATSNPPRLRSLPHHVWQVLAIVFIS